MAGYRPKSLDELNSMYDKTMAAEKAIRKGTSLLEKSEESIKINSQITEEVEPADNEPIQSQELSDAVSEFIAKYSQDTVRADKKEEPVIAKPQMTILSQEPAKTEKAPEAVYNIQQPEETVQTEKEPEKADRSDLMDEYIRIMTDEDDDVPEKKLSRKEKKKLKKKEKQAAMKAESAEAETEAEEVVTEENEVPFAPELQKESVEIPEYTIVYSEEEDTVTSEENTGKDDFDFPENYTPEWMEEEKKEETKEPIKKEKKTKHTALKALLGIVLVLLIALGGFATVLKTVLFVNTGKAFNDNYYLFTAEKDYANLNVSEDDLVITEKRYAEDGDIFVYIDYSERTFEFGKRSYGITNDDGEVLIVTEKEGSRTLVSRDDSKGVVYRIYPELGKYISFLTDNYIVVIAAVAVSAFVIILVLALVLRNKKESKSEDREEENEESDENLFATIE